MKKVIEVKTSDVANLDAVLSGTTNLVVVPFMYFQKINEMKANYLQVGDLDAEITWMQHGYACSIPNSCIILKIKRDIQSPAPENPKTVEFAFKEGFNPFTIGGIFEGTSVVLATHYFTEDDVPEQYKMPTETLQKLQSLNPGDWIVLTGNEGSTRRARMLSFVNEQNCPAMKTQKIGKIPYDYTSMIFELADVQ